MIIKLKKKQNLCSNFYGDEKDIGLRRDETSSTKLSELNNLVKCDYLKEDKLIENIKGYVKDYDIIIITEIMEIKDLIKIDKICYENKKGFIYCLVFVLTFFCFVNYGEPIINNKSIIILEIILLKILQKVKPLQLQ